MCSDWICGLRRQKFNTGTTHVWFFPNTGCTRIHRLSRTILNTFLYIFRGFYTGHRVDRVLSFFSSRRMGLLHPVKLVCGRGGGESQFRRRDRHCGSLGIYVLCGTASLENLPNTFCKKSAKHWRVCGRFLMCFPAIDRYRENSCKIFKMINTIAGEHIPKSIKINNVYSRYRLNSG